MNSFMEKIEQVFQRYSELIRSNLSAVFDLNHLYILLFTTFSLLVLELFFVGWKSSSFRKIIQFDRSTRIDFWAWFIETISLYKTVAIVLSFGVCYYLVGIIQKSVDIQFKIANPVLQFCIIFIISDFKNWGKHYVFHRFHSLWQIHSFHHAATNFNLLTRQRGHILESEIGRFFDVLPFVLLGAPMSSYFVLVILVEAHQMLLHGASNSDWGFVGRNILVSPAAHRVHHSIEEKHYNKNFGVTFIFWDKLFKTYHPRVEEIQIGIKDNPYNKGYIRDVFTTYTLFAKSIFGFFKRSNSKIES